MTNEEIATAYGVTKSFEQAKVEAYSTLVDDLFTAVNELLADFPPEAQSTLVYQTITQTRFHAAPTNYQLLTIRQQFGLAPAPMPVA